MKAAVHRDEAPAIVANVCETKPHFQLFKRALLDRENCFGATSLEGKAGTQIVDLLR